MTEDGPTGSVGASSIGETIARGRENALFRTIIESTSEGLFAVDESGTVIFANPAMEAVLGYAPSDLVGEPLSTVVPDRFGRQQTVIDLLFREDDASLDGGAVDLPAIHGDGRDCWISVSFSPFEYDGRRLIAGAVRDVSERREREEELARYERIIETIDDGIYILDANFTITNVNEAIVSMTGYSREELIGSHASILATADVLQKAAALSLELLESQREAATLVGEIVTKGGEQIPIETRFSLYPFDDESYGQVGVLRDITERKQFEETLTALHDSTRELLTVDTESDVCGRIVETATDVIDLSATVVYLFDHEENVLRPIASSNSEDGRLEELPTLDPGDGLPWRVFVRDETVILDEGSDELDPGLPIEEGMFVPLGNHGVFIAAAETGAFDDDTQTLIGLLAASAETALSRLEREAGIRRRDRKLQRQNRRLRQLDKVNAIIREIDQALVKAETTDEIGDAVCERLVASDRFAFAWIGEPDPTAETLRPRAWAGDERGYLDDVPLSTETPEEPAARAATDRELTVVSDVGSDLRNERWRKAALARDYRSVIGVPLLHGDIAHGVLTVYANRTGAFDDMTTVLRELGETIANAMNAVVTKRALLTDNRVELGFRLYTSDDVLQRFAQQAECTIEFKGIVPQAGGTSRVFFTTNSAESDLICSLEDRLVAVESVHLVAERGENCLFEAVIDGPNIATMLVDHGAAMRTITADGDEMHVNVEIPNDSDVREFVETVRSRYPNAELVSRRDRERPLRTPTEFRFEFENRLTDRQMDILRIAYLRGFFEWPRESTGQEIADSLGVSQPTVNRHLRACERKLFRMLFEEQ